MGMNIAGGAQKVKQAAADLGISAAEYVEAQRSDAHAASALSCSGMSNSNLGVQARNTDALRLGEQLGPAVMGPVTWARYITTSCKDMTKGDKPFAKNTTEQLGAERLSGELKGWVFHHTHVFHHAALSVSRWAMTDEITYTLPGHIEENPRLH